MKKIIALAGIFLTFGLISCDMGSEPEIGGTKVKAMAGEWWIKIMQDGKDVGGGYHLIQTSNTAANTADELLFDDLETWPAKFVAKVDLSTMTFTNKSSEKLANIYNADIPVQVFEGKILKNAATTTGKNKTDSIYVKMEFGDDPGSQYYYAGYRRTGFLEDEH